MSAIIECINISKTYTLNTEGNTSGVRVIKALNNVSFTLNEGDRLGLIGLNGSGKSTLLKILGGFIKPSSGKAILHKKVTSLSSFDSILHPDLNAIENCRLQLQVLGFKQADIPKAIDQIIEFSELTNFMYQPVKTFSSGMMLRLSFSIFSVTKPEVLLLDEVFSSGDINFQRKASELMLQSFKSTPAIIMASHQLSEIQQYCNKCLVLKYGEPEFWGSVTDALKFYQQQNKHHHESLPKNQFLQINSIVASQPEYKHREAIKLTVCYEKFTQQNIDLVINVRNAFGKIISDCMIYRPDFSFTAESPGHYKIEAILPESLLNAGVYFFDFNFGDGENDILKVTDALMIEVLPDDWEKDKLWNLNPEYPIRAKFNWTKQQIDASN
jgi:ABC-type polysaccharide/polyol phosphate transport system ATPase subunit